MPPSKKPKNVESFVKEPQKCSIQFKCTKCDFSSTSANSLTQHIKTTHPVVEDFDLITVNNLSMVKKEQEFDSIVVKEEQDSIKVGNVFSFEDSIVEDSIRELMKSVKTEAQDTDDSEKMKKIDTINVKDEIIIQNRDKSVTDGKTLVILEQKIVSENDETIHEGKYPGNLYVQEKYLPQLLPNKKVHDEKDLDKHYRDPSCKKDQNILAIHEKAKPFECDICHAYFVVKASLTKHIKKVHDEDEPESIFGI